MASRGENRARTWKHHLSKQTTHLPGFMSVRRAQFCCAISSESMFSLATLAWGEKPTRCVDESCGHSWGVLCWKYSQAVTHAPLSQRIFHLFKVSGRVESVQQSFCKSLTPHWEWWQCWTKLNDNNGAGQGDMHLPVTCKPFYPFSFKSHHVMILSIWRPAVKVILVVCMSTYVWLIIDKLTDTECVFLLVVVAALSQQMLLWKCRNSVVEMHVSSKSYQW